MKPILLIILAAFLTICGPANTKDAVSKTFGIDVSGGEEVSDYNTHSGNGDGASCVALHFDDNTVLEEIKSHVEWKEFPLDETVQALVYGTDDTASHIGPFLNDGNGHPRVPGIVNGYYLLIDRHTDKGIDLLHRASFNFTLGLYDTDMDILYFCKLDT